MSRKKYSTIQQDPERKEFSDSLFAQKETRRGDLWNWYRDGCITRNGKTVMKHEYKYDRLTFFFIIQNRDGRDAIDICTKPLKTRS